MPSIRAPTWTTTMSSQNRVDAWFKWQWLLHSSLHSSPEHKKATHVNQCIELKLHACTIVIVIIIIILLDTVPMFFHYNTRQWCTQAKSWCHHHKTHSLQMINCKRNASLMRWDRSLSNENIDHVGQRILIPFIKFGKTAIVACDGHEFSSLNIENLW